MDENVIGSVIVIRNVIVERSLIGNGGENEVDSYYKILSSRLKGREKFVYVDL